MLEFDTTKEALKIAIADKDKFGRGAPKRLFDHEGFGDPETNSRNLALAWRYAFDPDTTIGTLASDLGLTRQRVDELRKKVLRKIGQELSHGAQLLVKDRFGVPWDQIETRKPISTATKMRYSRALDGPTIKVFEMLQEGLTREKIMDELKLSQSALSEIARRIERSWGKEEARDLLSPGAISGERYKKVIETLTTPNGDSQIRDALNMISYYFLYKYRYKAKRLDLILTVGEIAKEAGFFYYNNYSSDFLRAVRESGIPCRDNIVASWEDSEGNTRVTGPYYIVAAQHKERVIEAFEQDKFLNKYKKPPVRELFGRSAPLPSSTEVVFDRESFIAVNEILCTAGITSLHGETIEDIIRDLGLSSHTDLPYIFVSDNIHTVAVEEAGILFDLISMAIES